MIDIDEFNDRVTNLRRDARELEIAASQFTFEENDALRRAVFSLAVTASRIERIVERMVSA